jgi:hypothetical protein
MQSTKSSKIPFRRIALRAFGLSALLAAVVPMTAHASSHREAPFITKNPQVDATDFYMFRSYQTVPDRSAYVTIVANYNPLQDAYGGPNYFNLDPDALYEIEIDNTGDSVEDLTFQFQFSQALANGGAGLTVPVSDAGGIPVPFTNLGDIATAANLNVAQTYSVNVIKGPRRGPATPAAVKVSGTSTTTFTKPTDNIGVKSFPGGYAAYANQFIYDVDIPNCPTPGKMFVGQRAESFAVNLGPVFDLIDASPTVVTGAAPAAGTHAGGPDVVDNPLAKKNITSIALEVPITCLTASGSQPIIGGWTTANVRQARVINPGATYTVPSKEGGAWTQVSRLSNPLVNELYIGIPDKDHFNASEPKDDATNFLKYVEYPSLAKVIGILFGAGLEPTVFPRADLVEAFLTGIPSANQFPAGFTPSEMIRLNTAVVPTATGAQSYLGAAGCVPHGVLGTNGVGGCDLAGFPNGRRPGDDVTDVALDVTMGFLLPIGSAGGYTALKTTLFTDGVQQTSAQFDATFPYLKTPTQGANGDGT